MTEIVLPPNHVAEVIRLLSQYFPKGTVRAEEPDSSTYDTKSLLILVKDGGSSKPAAHTYWSCMTTIEVRHGSRSEAKKVADTVDALLRAELKDDMSYVGSLNAPTYDPDLELNVPAYSFTQEHYIRGTKTSVEALTATN